MKKIKMMAVVLLFLAMLALTAAAAEGEYPYIFNDEIYFASGDKPIDILDGVVYAPLELYMEKLGATQIYDGVTRTLTLFKGSKIVAINMNTYQVITSDGRFPFAKTYFQNKSFYVPVEFLCKELGGKFTLLKDDVMRVTTTTRQKMSDGEMSAILASMPVTYTPVESPTIFLEIRGISGAGTQRMISTLDKYNVKAAFFATAREIANNPDVVRQLYIEGHTLGVYAGGMSNQGALNEANQANKLLLQLLKRKTSFVLYPDSEVSLRQSLSRNGFVTWGSNLNRIVEGAGSSINNVLDFIQWPVALLLRDDTASAVALDRILDEFPKSRFARISEHQKVIT